MEHFPVRIKYEKGFDIAQGADGFYNVLDIQKVLEVNRVNEVLGKQFSLVPGVYFIFPQKVNPDSTRFFQQGFFKGGMELEIKDPLKHREQ